MSETLGLIPRLVRSLEKGIVTHSSILCLDYPMDRGAGWAAVHGLVKELDTTLLLLKGCGQCSASEA